MESFRIDVPQADVDDLRARLARTRWTRPLPGRSDHVRELASYWEREYDWRAAEAGLNALPQFTETIDGSRIHFVHARSERPDALPLILTHGWPNTFAEFADVVEPLRRDFHVVAPSVPGFGFSDPAPGPMSVRRVAELWAELMRRLGYDRYGTMGGDLGAYVSPEVALVAPEHVAGVYVISGLGFPTEADVPGMTADERAAFETMQSADWRSGVDHHALLRAAPQTFAYAWNDSPAGALAWMVRKLTEFSAAPEPVEEVLGRDRILTLVSLYWFTGTFGTSSWPMYDSTGFSWPAGQTVAPTGVFSGPPGIRRLAERTNRITHWPTTNTSRHHFVAIDAPGALAADMAAFFDRPEVRSDHA